MYCLYLEFVSNLQHVLVMFYLHISIRLYFWYIICIFWSIYIYRYIYIIVCVWLFSKDMWHVCILCFELTYTCIDFATSHVLSFLYIYIYIHTSINSQKTFFSDQWANGGPQDYESAGQIMFQVAQVWVVVDFALIVWGVGNIKQSYMRNEEVHPIPLEVWCHVAKQLDAVYIFVKENVWRLCSGRLIINGSRNFQKVKIAFIFGNLVPVWIMFRQRRVLYQTTQFDGVGRAKQIRSTSSPSLQKSEVWFEALYDTGICELDTKDGDDFENKSGKCSSEHHGLSTPLIRNGCLS